MKCNAVSQFVGNYKMYGNVLGWLVKLKLSSFVNVIVRRTLCTPVFNDV